MCQGEWMFTGQWVTYITQRLGMSNYTMSNRYRWIRQHHEKHLTDIDLIWVAYALTDPQPLHANQLNMYVMHLSMWIMWASSRFDPRNSDRKYLSDLSPCPALTLSEYSPKISIFLSFVNVRTMLERIVVRVPVWSDGPLSESWGWLGVVPRIYLHMCITSMIC